MPKAPQNEFEGAQDVLHRYYERLVREIAEDIIEHNEDFEAGGFTGADELIEKHACRLSRLREVYWNLNRFGRSQKPEGTEPLGKDEFRCFGCGGVIRREDQQCRLCGWTWKLVKG